MKIFEFLASQSEKRPWLVVIIVSLFTLFFAAGVPLVNTELSQEAMMPRDYESIRALEEVGDLFGGISSETALLTAEEMTDPDITRTLLGLSTEGMVERGLEEGKILKVETYLDFLKDLPGMIGIEVKASDLTMSDAMLAQLLDFYLEPDPGSPFLGLLAGSFGMELPEDAAEELMMAFQKNSERVGEMLSQDPPATLLRFQLSPDIREDEIVSLANRLEEAVRAEFAHIEGAEVFISGDASMQRDAQEFMQRETSKLMIIALLFIMLILYLTFRRLSDIGLPMLIIILAVVWVVGVMGWVGITYTTMSVAVIPLMLGINIAYVIHILNRYYEEREGGLSVNLSATTSIKTVGVAVFLTALTTLIGFSSFMISDMPPMRDFGLLCMLGIAFSFCLSLTLLPAIIVIRDRRKREARQEAHLEKMRRRRRDARFGVVIDRALVRMATVSERNHWAVAVVTLAMIALAVFAVFSVRTGADMRKMMPEDMPSMEAGDMITDIFGPQHRDIILVKGDIYEPENLSALLELGDAIAGDARNQPGRDDYFNREAIISIADIMKDPVNGTIPESREEIEERIRESERVPQLRSLLPVERDGLPPAVMVTLLSAFPDTEDELKLKTKIMRDQSAVIAEEVDLELTPTGFTVLVADLLGNILPTQLKTSGLALLLCALVLVIIFKSLIYGLATLIVVICGIAAELIFLLVLGWPLDLMTVMVASLVIGAGIDFGIHITYRFREELHGNGTSMEESIRNTVKHVGRALFAAALTTAGVFFILGFSNMGMMQRFGFTTAVGLLGAFLGAILVLPSVLAIATKIRGKGAAAVPSSTEADGRRQA